MIGLAFREVSEVILGADLQNMGVRANNQNHLASSNAQFVQVVHLHNCPSSFIQLVEET